MYCISGLFQKCNQRSPPEFGGGKIHGCLYLRKHRTGGKVAFLDVLFCLIDGYVLKPLLIWFSEVQSYLFYSGENNQIIGVKLFCQQAACKVFVDYGAGTF